MIPVWEELTLEELLRRKGDISPSGCWIARDLSSDGYGQFRFRGTMYRLSRLALMIKLGRSLDGLACHKVQVCQDKACFNPDHLYEGSYTDNNRDTARKGYRWIRSRNRKNRVSVDTNQP